MTQFELSSCVLPNSWYQWYWFITDSVNAADQLGANIRKCESAFCVAIQELELKQSSERKGIPPGTCGKINYSVPLQLNLGKERMSRKTNFKTLPGNAVQANRSALNSLPRRHIRVLKIERSNRTWPGSIQPLTRHGR